MKIVRNGTNPSETPLKDYFTGKVRMDTPFQAEEPGCVGGVTVTFEPGARTAWHTHPRGQTLIVTSGLGWAQREGGAREEIRPGDVVWFPADERHWHGATDKTSMTHIAIAEPVNGSRVTWEDHVTDKEYLAG